MLESATMMLRETMTAIGSIVTLGVALSAALIAWAVVVAPTAVVSGLMHASGSRTGGLVVRVVNEALTHLIALF